MTSQLAPPEEEEGIWSCRMAKEEEEDFFCTMRKKERERRGQFCWTDASLLALAEREERESLLALLVPPENLHFGRPKAQRRRDTKEEGRKEGEKVAALKTAGNSTPSLFKIPKTWRTVLRNGGRKETP